MWRRFFLVAAIILSASQVASIPHATAQEATLLVATQTQVVTIEDFLNPEAHLIQAYVSGAIPQEPQGTVTFTQNEIAIEGCMDVPASYIISRLQANCNAVTTVSNAPITATYSGTETLAASTATFVQ